MITFHKSALFNRNKHGTLPQYGSFFCNELMTSA